MPRRTSQLLGRWLLAQPVIPGTAGLGWQDTVPGQAGVLWLAMESPGAPGRALSEVCQRDISNVPKPRTALGTLLGRRKALIPLIAVFFRNADLKCRAIMAWPKSCRGPLVIDGCESGSLDPQAITWPSRSPEQLC